MPGIVEQYVERLRQRGATLPHRQRFYLFGDPGLWELEEQLAPEDVLEFYQAVKAVYEEWMREMDRGEWRALVAHNDSLPGALRNHWFGDVLTSQPCSGSPAEQGTDRG